VTKENRGKPMLSVTRAAAMGDEPKCDRQELQRRLAVARRLAAQPNDPLTQGRLDQVVRELEQQLGQNKQT
jgi:hypothetical protein